MFSNTGNTPSSSEIPRELYSAVLQRFDILAKNAYIETRYKEGFTVHMNSITSQDLDTYLSNTYQRQEVLQYAEGLGVSEEQLADICIGFESSLSEDSPTLKQFRDHLATQSQIKVSQAKPTDHVIIDAKKKADWLTPKHIAVGGASVLAVAACSGVVGKNLKPDTLKTGSQNEHVETPEERAERESKIIAFQKLAGTLSQTDLIAVFNVDGDFTIQQEGQLQDAMIDCNNDLDPTDVNQAVPETCDTAVDMMESFIEADFDQVLTGLQAAPQTHSTVLKIKMMQEYKSIIDQKTSELDILKNTPNVKPSDILLAVLTLISLLLALIYWKAQGKRQLANLAGSTNAFLAKEIDEKFRPIKDAISVLTRNTKSDQSDSYNIPAAALDRKETIPEVDSEITSASIVSPKPGYDGLGNSIVDTTPDQKRASMQRYAKGGRDIAPEQKEAAIRAALQSPINVKGGTLEGSDFVRGENENSGILFISNTSYFKHKGNMYQVQEDDVSGGNMICIFDQDTQAYKGYLHAGKGITDIDLNHFTYVGGYQGDPNQVTCVSAMKGEQKVWLSLSDETIYERK